MSYRNIKPKPNESLTEIPYSLSFIYFFCLPALKSLIQLLKILRVILDFSFSCISQTHSVSKLYGSDGLVLKSCPTLATPWTVACQTPLSIGFSRQEYWSGLPFPSPGDLPNPGIEPRFPTLQADSLPTELQGKPQQAG